MTVPTLNSVAEFATNGVTTNYPFFFKFLANEDLIVTYVNPAGVSAVLTYGSQYTVNGAGDDDGGSVVTTTALAGPGQLIVSREMDAYQQTSLRNQGKFLAETHEDVFDRLTMLIQQGFSIFKRALVRPFGRDYYDAEGRRIANVANPVEDQDSATKWWVSQFVGDLISAIQGPINNALNVFYQYPDGTAHVVQDLSDADGADGIGHRGTSVRKHLDQMGITPYNFGAIGDGVADDTLALIAWSSSSASSQKFIGEGVFKCTQTLQFNPGDSVFGNGDGSVLDFSGSTPGAACVKVSGQLDALPDLASTIALKDNVVSFSAAHNLQTGDVILVWNPTDYSWSTWRPDYRAGEWMRAGLITSSTDLTIFGLTYDAYSAAPGTVQLYKLSGKSTRFENFTIRQPATSNAGLLISLIDSPVVKNVRTGGGIYAGVSFDRCVDIECDTRAIQASTASGNNYGLVLSNCQGGSVKGQYYGTRHSISIGGAPGVGSVCTRGLIIEANMKNLGPTPSQDLHGNSEDITFIGGTFTNGGQVAGKNHTFVGCNFIGKSNSGIALFMGEVKGGLFSFLGCHFGSLVDPNPSSNGVISFANFTASVTEACDFVFTGSTMSCASGTTFPVYLALNGTSVSVDVEFKGGLTFIRAPDITTVLRIRQLIPAGPGVYGKISMPEVTGIPATCAYATEIGSPTVANYCLPSQVGSASPAATTAISTASIATSYPHAYPRAPRLLVSNSNPTTGGKRVTPGYTSRTATGFNAQLATCDGANFASNETGSVSWISELNES